MVPPAQILNQQGPPILSSLQLLLPDYFFSLLALLKRAGEYAANLTQRPARLLTQVLKHLFHQL